MKYLKKYKKARFIFFGNFLIILVILSNIGFAQVNVLMNHNNLKRTGWNDKETILAVDNVGGGNFGKIFSRDVDDQIYAQPLVVSNVNIGGVNHNVVFVATVNNTVYAFDADDPNASTPYWKVNLTYSPLLYRPIKASDMTYACGGNYKDFSGNMGIVGTPAIDTTTNTLYVVARSVTKTLPHTFVQYLHAIDIRTGTEKPNSPVYITASVPGTGDGNIGGIMTFNQQKQNQRPGLLLYNNVVYIAWASHCDWPPFQGWVMGYDASTLTQKYVYNDAPNGGLAGIWMSGQPPAVDDSGYIYLTTGNGTTGQAGDPNNPINRGSSLLKLTDSLTLVDFFTPANYNYLNNYDLDYGVDGVLLLPDTHLSLSGSKEGTLFLLDNNNLGKTTSDDNNVIQKLNVTNSSTSTHSHLHGSPVYYKDEYHNEYIYAWSEGSLLKQFPFIRSQKKFDTLNTKIGNTALPNGMPGAMLSVSSNGSQHGSAILWANHPINGDANQALVPGVLQAFDATDVTKELWSSNWSAKRDSIGTFAKFVFPTIANGKVYMATFSKKLNVYGLNPPPATPCISTLPPVWQSADIGYTKYAGDVCVNNGVYTLTASGADVWNTADAFHYVYQPVVTNQTELSFRVASIQNTNAWAKVGVMFRQNLDAGSPYVFLCVTPGKNITLQERYNQSSAATSTTTSLVQGAPYWVRVFNDGNKYISYVSPNGDDWTPLDSVIVAMGPNSYIGIAYSSHDNTSLGTAVIDNVSLTMGGALGANLLKFTAKNINDEKTLLNWIANNDSPNTRFEIQRSGKRTEFETIATIPASPLLQKDQEYNFTDNAPLDGINYYRLRVVDGNGKIAFSQVVSIRFNLKKIEFYPNPAKNKIFIHNNINFSKGQPVNVRLMDFGGKTILKQIFATAGVNILTINLPAKISNGIYLLFIANSLGEKQGEKVFINR